MTSAALHATPRAGVVFREQVSAVALALRTPAIIAACIALVATALTIGEFITSGGAVDFAPELSMVPGMLGALFPIAVWKGEARFGASFLWTLPVDRRQLALTKVAAGWVCLMTTIAAFVLWTLVVALVTGGNVLGEQTLTLLPSAVVPPPGILAPEALHTARFVPSPLLWLIPFTGATATYLLVSALALGARHPLRWVVGTVMSMFVVSAIGSAEHVDSLRFFPATVARLAEDGRYGLDAILSARAESLKTVVTLANGKTIGVWRGLPNLGDWGVATALWIGVGLAALIAAASRHGEQRRR